MWYVYVIGLLFVLVVVIRLVFKLQCCCSWWMCSEVTHGAKRLSKLSLAFVAWLLRLPNNNKTKATTSCCTRCNKSIKIMCSYRKVKEKQQQQRYRNEKTEATTKHATQQQQQLQLQQQHKQQLQNQRFWSRDGDRNVCVCVWVCNTVGNRAATAAVAVAQQQSRPSKLLTKSVAKLQLESLSTSQSPVKVAAACPELCPMLVSVCECVWFHGALHSHLHTPARVQQSQCPIPVSFLASNTVSFLEYIMLCAGVCTSVCACASIYMCVFVRSYFVFGFWVFCCQFFEIRNINGKSAEVIGRV